ncbi:MAG TPA: hypothetical protein VF841_07565 [Anaeromyxobacter sp.]
MPRSPSRVHDRTSFFKYMPASKAQIVLSNKAMTWSSPVRFNDPFDTPRDMASGVWC